MIRLPPNEMDEQMNQTLDEEIRRIATDSCTTLFANAYGATEDQVESAIRAGIEAWKRQEPTEEMLEAAKPAFAQINEWCAEMQLVRGRVPNWSPDNPPLKQAYRAMMSASLPPPATT